MQKVINIASPSSVKSPVVQSYSAQPSSFPSTDTISELSGISSGNNKIGRKISLPALSTSPPPEVDSREVCNCYMHKYIVHEDMAELA